MKPKKRQKLCHNCEGEIDIDVIVCPFCAADLREEKPEQRYSSFSSQVHHMGGSPVFQANKPSQILVKEPVADVAEEVAFAKEETLAQEENPSSFFLPVFLFTIGVQLFVFGLLMFLFSNKGVVLLKWDARWWFLYPLAGIPFLVLGFRFLSRVRD
jgi:hypothetical protein